LPKKGVEINKARRSKNINPIVACSKKGTRGKKKTMEDRATDYYNDKKTSNIKKDLTHGFLETGSSVNKNRVFERPSLS